MSPYAVVGRSPIGNSIRVACTDQREAEHYVTVLINTGCTAVSVVPVF